MVGETLFQRTQEERECLKCVAESRRSKSAWAGGRRKWTGVVFSRSQWRQRL